MGRLENLKRQATEAAKSEFLWKLGYLAPSRHKAHDVCDLWGLTNADQKRVTAVTALRDQYPEVLEEIRKAAFPEEEMTEVLLGPRHYELEARKKCKELWDAIFKRLHIIDSFKLIRISQDMCSDYWKKRDPDGKTRHADEDWREFKRAALDGLCEWAVDITHSNNIILVSPSDFSMGLYGAHVINKSVRVWSAWPVHVWAHDIRLNYENSAPSFYFPRHEKGVLIVREKYKGLSAPSINGPFYCDAVISVSKKESLNFAKRLANAYKAETARRHHPAKAIILKDY